jgi:hypothetical protein
MFLGLRICNYVYVLGSGCFHQEQKKYEKNLDFYFFVTSLNDLLSMKADENVPTVNNKQKTTGSVTFGADPDPHL